MSPRRKIVFLAMDAGDKNLIKEWAADGTMPTMGLLLSRGLVGDTTSVDGLYEGSTWPCLYTGVNPGRHGFHRTTQIRPGTYDFYRCDPGDFIEQEPFWNRLSRAGERVAILDVPLSGVSQEINGIQTVEWGSHDAVYGFQAWPGELKEDIIGRFGHHPLGDSCDSAGRSPKEFREFRDRLIEGVGNKRELTLHYLKQDDWDFFTQVFTEGHCVGHQCWHLHDPAHPNHRRGIVSRTGDPMREVYIAIDRALGEILAQVDENALVFFLATHGMSHNTGGDFLLEQILEKLDLIKRPPAAGDQGGMSAKLLRASLRGWRGLPGVVRRSLRPVLRPMLGRAGSPAARHPAPLSSRMDLEKCACFLHDNGGLVSGIRVNLSGREPLGVVGPGSEFDEFCRQLSEDLLAITERTSGQPMVSRVVRTSDLFQGDRLDHLPDLLVEWNQEICVGSKAVRDDASCRVGAVSDKVGLVEAEYGYCRTGDHRQGGLFAVLGPGVRAGTMTRTVSIMDFAATFLSMFGLACDDLDGRPITEISGSSSGRCS